MSLSLFEYLDETPKKQKSLVSKLLSGTKWDCSTGLLHILYSKNDLSVRTTSILDWNFVDKMQKDNSFSVGFIQRTIWDKYVWGGERNFIVLICEKNHDPVGYILITPGRAASTYAKIQQIVVRNDARRLEYGTALLSVARMFCEEFSRHGFTLRCRVDLESNLFWGALGFHHYGTWEKGKLNHVGMMASDDINLWMIDLNSNQPPLFAGGGIAGTKGENDETTNS
ncbi:MAG: GNAT family N-acetyltransferase [Sphaerochaeta sp.]|jgi:predicted GNAT family N-acyltransferase|nr:GNAT family N-acetyltransferase [Sphaerochaeta sp.]